MGFGFGFLNFIGTILFIILIVWVIKSVARGGWRSGRWQQSGQDDAALNAARERFARSEISAEEYEALRQGLRQGEERGQGRSFGGWFDGGDKALELARMRFARGEIDLEEFERIRRGLTA